MKVKRIALIALFIILCLTALLFLAPRLRESSRASYPTLQAIPVDAALVVRLNGLPTLAESFSAPKEGVALLQSIPFWEAFDSIAKRINKGANSSSAIQSELLKGEVHLSLHPQKNDDPGWLCAIYLPKIIKDAETLASFFLPAGRKTKEKLEYNGTQIFWSEGIIGDSTQRAFFAVKDGIALFATNRGVMEASLRTLPASHSLLKDPHFMHLYEKSDSFEPIVLFANSTSFFPSLAQKFCAPWRQRIASLANWTTWLTLDMRIESEGIRASGVSYQNDTINLQSAELKRISSSKLLAPSVLPSGTPFFIRWGNLANEKGSDTPLFGEHWSGELALAYLPFPELSPKDRWAVLVSSQSPSLACEAFRGKLGNAGEPRSVRLDQRHSITVHRAAQRNYFRQEFNAVFPDSVARYFTTLDNFVVFSRSAPALERMAISLLRRKTLGGDANFQTLQGQLKTESNFMVYLAPGRQKEVAAELFANEARWYEKTDRIGLQGLAVQASGARELVFYNAVATHNSSALPLAQTQWETRLEAPVAERPLLVKSHLSKNREVLVRDTLHNLYLISGLGSILWKKPLGEPILGDPEQVDIYKNGKLQYAFLTSQALWVVDRNGNNVEGFPVRFSSKVTAPLSIFDYDKNRDYRFTVCLADKSARMYDSKGRQVVGFAPAPFDSPIEIPPLHARTGGKDFLIFSEQNRLYILDRRGNERLVSEAPVARAAGSPVMLLENGGLRLGLINGKGSLCLISFENGSVQEVKLPEWASGSSAVFYPQAAKGEPCVAVVNNRKITSYDKAGNRIAQRKFDSALASGPRLFRFGIHDWRLGVLEPKKQQIWLLDSKMNPVEGFPLPGSSPFTIGHLDVSAGKFNLITGGTASLLFNYSIEE